MIAAGIREVQVANKNLKNYPLTPEALYKVVLNFLWIQERHRRSYCGVRTSSADKTNLPPVSFLCGGGGEPDVHRTSSTLHRLFSQSEIRLPLREICLHEGKAGIIDGHVHKISERARKRRQFGEAWHSWFYFPIPSEIKPICVI